MIQNVLLLFMTTKECFKGPGMLNSYFEVFLCVMVVKSLPSRSVIYDKEKHIAAFIQTDRQTEAHMYPHRGWITETSICGCVKADFQQLFCEPTSISYKQALKQSSR